MKLRLYLLIAGLFLASVTAGLGQAADSIQASSGWQMGSELSVQSRYLWRGIALSPGRVIQPTAWLGKGNATVTLWANCDIGSAAANPGMNEIDVTVDYQMLPGPVAVKHSFNYYYLRCNPGQSSGEVIIEISKEIGIAAISFRSSVDVLTYRGSYFGELELTVGESIGDRVELEQCLGLGAGSSAFNQVNLGCYTSAVNLLKAELSATYRPNQRLYVKPAYSWQRIIDRNLRDAAPQSQFHKLSLSIGIEH
ncbi:MAG: hypothetical protein QME74_02510 [Candidatus Edwardsbacteria bacterium]|nr:hypothetical protein [Candidatus Edwardsbacteria bacterium]